MFNDLPQKLSEYIESGLLPFIVRSMEARIPAQQDFPLIVTKFIRMLLLNQGGTKLVLESQLIERLSEMALAHEVKSEIVILHQSDREFDLRGLFQGLAAESQDISDRILKANMSNFEALNVRAWDLTRAFLEMEKQNRESGEPEAVIQARKDQF